MFNILLWIIVICGAFILFVGALGILCAVLYEIDEIRKRIRIEKFLKEARDREEEEKKKRWEREKENDYEKRT